LIDHSRIESGAAPETAGSTTTSSIFSGITADYGHKRVTRFTGSPSIAHFRNNTIRSIGSPVLGEGAHGKVRLERDAKNHEKKIAGTSMSWDGRYEFIREFEALVNLQHRCVSKIDAWSLDDYKIQDEFSGGAPASTDANQEVLIIAFGLGLFVGSIMIKNQIHSFDTDVPV
jgi:hypothetical protein